VQHATKYVYLHASSGFKGQSDLKKYEKARKLKDYIEKIRRDYGKNLKSKVVLKKQIATAMWVIDVLALRVGGEKNDDEADTVGCCSLRVEHFTFEDESNAIVLDFLGKDSMRYYETIDFEKYGDVGTLVYANFKAFCKKKSGTSDVFDQLTPSIPTSTSPPSCPASPPRSFVRTMPLSRCRSCCRGAWTPTHRLQNRCGCTTPRTARSRFSAITSEASRRVSRHPLGRCRGSWN